MFTRRKCSLTLVAVTAFASRSHQTLRSDGQDAPTRAPGPDGSELGEEGVAPIDVDLVSETPQLKAECQELRLITCIVDPTM